MSIRIAYVTVPDGDRRRDTSLIAQLRAIRAALESERPDWIVVLGGGEDPGSSATTIEASLAAADDVDAFIDAHPCMPGSGPAEPVDEFALRYHYRWSRVPAGAAPAARALAAICGRRLEFQTTPDGAWLGAPAKRSPFARPRRSGPLLPQVRRNPLDVTVGRPPDPPLTCYRGPDRFVLSRRAAEAIAASLRERPTLAIYYRDTLYPTESYIHTVLANDPSMKLVNYGELSK